MIRDSYEYWHSGISDTVVNKKNFHPSPHYLFWPLGDIQFEHLRIYSIYIYNQIMANLRYKLMIEYNKTNL